MMASRKPDYRLAAMDKATDEKNNDAGAAWINPDGSISITLRPFIVLSSHKNLVLTLFLPKADLTKS